MALVILRITALFFIVTRSMGQSREILLDDDRPAVKAENEEQFLQEVPCNMDYQVVKRVVGTCIKLGRSARGCVAGNYLQPLHPECM
ncbi:hypothetical protein TcasGA2_TC032886 [Tribolium castaneum]|uniref:Uncharacterized protein n=1 Tax=Tribolium castaneum TaxID=7070 RepID=A0A139WJV9_TRICA|nr:hypothetical protein TcasGA2_TC032886 [Tribolium castaneum]